METKPTYHTAPFYIGIDPSLRASGLVGLNSEDRPILSLTVNTAPSGPYIYARFARVEEIVGAITKQILALGQPELVAIESYNMHANNAGTCALIELGTLLRARCLANSWHVIEIPPATLKLFAAGHGNADKAAVASALTATFNQTFISADDADAYGLAQIARCFCEPERYDRRQRDTLLKLRPRPANRKEGVK